MRNTWVPGMPEAPPLVPDLFLRSLGHTTYKATAVLLDSLPHSTHTPPNQFTLIQGNRGGFRVFKSTITTIKMTRSAEKSIELDYLEEANLCVSYVFIKS